MLRRAVDGRRKASFWYRVRRNFRTELPLHLLVLPAVVGILIFHYVPIYGIQLAFKNFSYAKGIGGSPWVGMAHFQAFFQSFYFGRLIKNTVLLSLYSLIFSFPFPILFALLLNELRAPRLKKVYQTISYLPHFVSVVVLVGLMQSLLSPAGGPIDKLTHALGGQRVDYMRASRWFRTLYVGSGIWQSFGWNSIVYLAALTGISPELYEAATVDGANRYRQALHVTLPGIMPTMVILLILNMGNILNVGSDKILLMYSPNTYDVADVISTYVYRKSLLGGEFSFGVAMGLFNNVFNLLFVAVANAISRRVTEVSLW